MGQLLPHSGSTWVPGGGVGGPKKLPGAPWGVPEGGVRGLTGIQALHRAPRRFSDRQNHQLYEGNIEISDLYMF